MAIQGKREIDQLLAVSFKELACIRPIEKITIKEITDQAGVIRTTFYNHFQDKYELLEWIITNDLLWPIQPLVENAFIHGLELKEGIRWIMLTGTVREGKLYVEVKDNGIGMEPERLSLLLEDITDYARRDQVQARKPEGGGSSIGLKNINKSSLSHLWGGKLPEGCQQAGGGNCRFVLHHRRKGGGLWGN